MEVLQNLWYCTALSTELSTKPIARVICGVPLVLFRTESGRAAVLEDRCSHRQAPLSMGVVVGEEIQCVYHGFVFDTAGTCTHIPHQDAVPTRACITAYPTAERWGYVWIWWGDAARADPARIPDLPWTAEATRSSVYIYFYVKANFQLMADNLLDVSHTDFLHRQSIGSQTGKKGQANPPRMTIETRTEGDRVHSLRRVYDTRLGAVAAAWAGTDEPVDRISTQMWEPPNTTHIRLQFKHGDRMRTINMEHIMTPETERTTHYFMNWTRDFGVHGGYPTDADVYREQTGIIGGEDIPIVEAQQRSIDQYGGTLKDVPAKQDRLVNDVHRLLKKLYAEARIAGPAEIERLAAE
jgi:vanillate O-demethylase monooxygenase subunit